MGLSKANYLQVIFFTQTSSDENLNFQLPVMNGKDPCMGARRSSLRSELIYSLSVVPDFSFRSLGLLYHFKP